MGGDHKCPLCSATFTRPQHVGRHLRAHTGDRPYACKECPLKFARSDLLSRHVNKAHRSPDAGPVDKKPAKKGRRKSVPASAHSSLDRDKIIAEQQQQQQQQDYQRQRALQQQQQAHAQQQQQAARERSRSESHVIQQPQLQAQRMYPHHPLLAVHPVPPAQPGGPQESWNTNPSGSVGTFGMMTMSPQPTYGPSVGRPMPVNPPVHSATYPLQPAFDPPFTAQPLKMSGPMDQQIPSQSMYEWDTKKRACDQCNHSKVRCDFADPCLRCKQRNLTCSYRKPQRPSSYMGPPLPPAQVAPFPSSSPSNMSISSSTQPSPQFTQMQMPSIAPTEPVAYRKPSVSSLPPNLGNVPNPNPSPVMSHGPAHGIGGWDSFPQTTVGGTWPPNMGGQQSLSYADNTAPGSITGQAYKTSPNSLDVPLPAPASPIPPNANASGKISPGRMGLLQTPSLVSNAGSPSEMDEPAERRGSHNSAISATSTFAPAPFWTKGKGSEGTLGFQPNIPDIHTHQDISPSHSQSQLPFLAGSGPQLNDPQGQQQWHLRNSFSGGSDDTSSILSSSVTSSSMFDPNSSVSGASAGHQPGHARRRSSQTAWAHALEQMTLGESQKQALAARMREGSESAVSAHSDLSPEGGRQPLQPQPEGQQIMPTLSDVKDLWKVFMSEPMDLTGLAPVAEGDGSGMDLDHTHEITPRPGLGKRTLSKSNSMPDLQSPMINGPNFFSTFLNGMTPKASEAHASQSYIGVHVPSEQGHGQGQQEGGGSIPDIGSWKDQIQQRQSSFSLGAPGKSKSKGSQSALPLDAAVPLPSRPLPSVVQRTALDQTLAPERIPSFGLTPGLEMSTNPHLASKLSQSTTPALAGAAGLTSAEARGGNKRMASLSLVNDHGKRASFSVWGEEEPVGRDEDVQDPATEEPLYAGAREKGPLSGQQQGLVQGWAAA